MFLLHFPKIHTLFIFSPFKIKPKLLRLGLRSSTMTNIVYYSYDCLSTKKEVIIKDYLNQSMKGITKKILITLLFYKNY